MIFRDVSGQALAPTVSAFASQSRVPDIRPTSSTLRQQGIALGSRSYHNATAKAGGPHIQPQTSLVTHSRLNDPPSSAPVPGGVRGNGHVNLPDPRPSTAPILVPRSPVADIPPPRKLPFGPTRSLTNGGLSPPPVASATSISLANLKQGVFQDSQAEVQKIRQTTTPQSMTVQPAQSATSTVGDVTKPPAADPVRAEDIDTQQLLEKVAVRRTEPAKTGQNSETTAKTSSATHSHTEAASQKRRKNASCTQCRSKRIKCRSNEDNLDGACQTCLDTGRHCSFIANAEETVAGKAVTLVQPKQKVQDSQETALKVLRSREIHPVDATAALVSQDIPIQEVKQTEICDQNLPVKRLSQLAMPAPKRVKAQKREVKPKPQTTGGNTRSKEQSQRSLSFRASNPEHAIQGLSNSPTHLRSDATTATVDTFDLDPVEEPQKPLRKLSPPRPLYSELSAITDHSEPADHANATSQSPQQPEATADFAPLSKPSNTQSASSFAPPLAELMHLSPNEQNTWLDQAFAEALQDDSFIPFCEMVNARWERHLFGFKNNELN